MVDRSCNCRYKLDQMVRPISARPTSARSTSDVIQDQLLGLVTGGILVVDERLPAERELAQQLGISRTTLRDALRSLEQSGVLESRQGAGWFVRHSTDGLAQNLALHFRLQDITFGQLVEARRAIEPIIAALAAARRTEAEMDEIRGIFSVLLEEGDHERWVQSDYRFHATIARASHNPFFAIAVQPALTLLTSIRTEVVSRPGARNKSNREHAAVVKALESRDARAAELAMIQHLRLWTERGRGLFAATAQGLLSGLDASP